MYLIIIFQISYFLLPSKQMISLYVIENDLINIFCCVIYYIMPLKLLQFFAIVHVLYNYQAVTFFLKVFSFWWSEWARGYCLRFAVR